MFPAVNAVGVLGYAIYWTAPCNDCHVASHAAAPGETLPAVPDVAVRVVPAAAAERFAVPDVPHILPLR